MQIQVESPDLKVVKLNPALSAPRKLTRLAPIYHGSPPIFHSRLRYKGLDRKVWIESQLFD